jgi:DNA-binding transcriptional ArsR family regulator
MAGHMHVDKIAARRAALIDLLSDGRPHPREEIWEAIAVQLGEECWGKLPQEALARDLSALRKGGIRIVYSRRPGVTGYYLQHPSLARPRPRQFGATNWELVRRLRRMPLPEKNAQAFAAADFALTQRRLILAEEHPDWDRDRLGREARRLVFGLPEKVMP